LRSPHRRRSLGANAQPSLETGLNTIEAPKLRARTRPLSSDAFKWRMSLERGFLRQTLPGDYKMDRQQTLLAFTVNGKSRSTMRRMPAAANRTTA
jgi:hypothetical protein